MGTFRFFEMIIAIQLFYAFSVTLIVYALPPGTADYISVYQTNVSIENTSVQVQQSIQKQMDIPVVDLGALVFYSGNIIIDLMLNFLTAIPGMFSMLLTGIFAIINVDAYIATQLKIFSTAMLTIAYIILMIQFIMGIRARGTIV